MAACFGDVWQVGVVLPARVAEIRDVGHLEAVGDLDALFLELDDLRPGQTDELLLELLPNVDQ